MKCEKVATSAAMCQPTILKVIRYMLYQHAVPLDLVLIEPGREVLD
jgi:hypothetical protein